ncbi:MAG: DUF4292 domain-containing protein [Bacteroidia bacterium]|nr:DUF4292 domain-containing protein [Bacteroidia bacterium]
MKGFKFNTWYLIIGLALILVSCRSKKSVIAPPTVNTTIIDSGTTVTAESLLQPFQKNWTFFSAKIDFEFTQNGSNTKANAHIRMYKDSLIWISAGMGLFRIMINNDSMVILDKLNTNYRVFDKQSLSQVIDVPLNVTQIQNLLMGQPAFALKLYQLAFTPDSNLNILYHQVKFDTKHSIQRSVMTMDSTRINDNLTTNYASAVYSSYSVVDEHNLPLKIELSATGNKPIKIILEYSDADYTTELTFPFTIPNSYEKVK